MKEIKVRDRGQQLKLEQKDGYTIYKCPYCGNELVEIDNQGNYHNMSSCPHYQWEELSISCYIGIGDECFSTIIMKLRRMSLIQIFDDIWVNLLLPKEN